MDWKSIVKSVAPVIGSALGGPAGGMAAKFLAGELLGNEDASAQQVEEFVKTASPDQMLRLKELDQAFEAKMKALDIDVFKLEMADRSNARELYKINVWPQIVISALFIAGYFIIAALMLNRSIVAPPGFEIIFGVVTAAIPMILQFWFGSSMGSKEKTAKLGSPVP